MLILFWLCFGHISTRMMSILCGKVWTTSVRLSLTGSCCRWRSSTGCTRPLDFICKKIDKSIANHILVVTYHLPTRWKLRTISRIDACIYGYLHTNIDVEIGVTRINSDQIGYIFANDHLMNWFPIPKRAFPCKLHSFRF